MKEHVAIVDAYVAYLDAIPDTRWTSPMPGRTWSAAEETLHLVKAYELPLGDGQMRLRVSKRFAWVLGNFYLRWLLWRKTFHHGAKAPSEVRPDLAEAHAIPRTVLVHRLRTTSNAAAETLKRMESERPEFRLQHAYFGHLTALTGLRMLNAHTRHHLSLSRKPPV